MTLERLLDAKAWTISLILPAKEVAATIGETVGGSKAAVRARRRRATLSRARRR